MKRESIIRNSLILCMLIAAGLHLWIVPLHWSHAIAHGLLFFVLGVLQIIWSFIFLKRASVGVSQWGIYLAGSSITLWVITRILPAPFGHGAESITLIGIATKIVEVLVIVFLFVWVRKKMSLRKKLKSIVISVAVGIFVYGGGKISEPFFQGLESPELDRGHEVHTHQDDAHHSDSSH